MSADFGQRDATSLTPTLSKEWRGTETCEPDWLEDRIPIEAVRHRQSTREAVLLTLQDAVLEGVVP